ncbi:MAG: hypothetical protein ACI8X5_000806 [Planctomycetota bacterium]|jgi:hypothetical protein
MTLNQQWPFALLSTCFFLASQIYAEGENEISAGELEEHVSFLASDDLEGRSIGSAGIDLASEYLADQLESYGLQPAGDEGSFLQEMFFEIESYEALPELVIGESLEATYGADFRMRRGGVGGKYELQLVGKGDLLPAVRGAKTALCLLDMNYSSARKWLKENVVEEESSYGLIVSFSSRAGKAATSLPRTSRPKLVSDSELEQHTPWIELAPEYEARIAAGEIATLNLDMHYNRKIVASHNVIGRLPGSSLGKEIVVVSAHYDHNGTQSALPEQPDADLIQNGADDDASGVACVLELAQKFAANGPQAREMIFFLATAEELGVVGTTFYIDHAGEALQRIVANLNFEMIGRPDDNVGGAGRMWLTGFERTNLMDTYRDEGIDIAADPYPAQNFFMRSDNIVFCMKGIVGHTFSSYNLHKDYHTVRDETEFIDFEHMYKCTQAGYEAVRLVADGTITPEWLEGGQPKPR